MSTTTKDGGPAFPQQGATLQVRDGVYFLEKGGMSLRDWFAGHALCGMIASGSEWDGSSETHLALNQPTAFAMAAFAFADAMLKARENKA